MDQKPIIFLSFPQWVSLRKYLNCTSEFHVLKRVLALRWHINHFMVGGVW